MVFGTGGMVLKFLDDRKSASVPLDEKGNVPVGEKRNVYVP